MLAIVKDLTFGELMRPLMTSDVILSFVRNVRLHNVSIYYFFYQHRLMYVCARKNLNKNRSFLEM